VLHLGDAVASKVTAMIGRGLPRDYIDVAAALRRYDRGDLLRLAFHRDPGLRVLDVALCMQPLDRLPDAPFADYGLTDDDVRQVRHMFQDWPRDHEQDHEGRRIHTEVHQQDRASAADLAAAGFPTPLHDALHQDSPGPGLAPQPCQHTQAAGRSRTAVPAQDMTRSPLPPIGSIRRRDTDGPAERTGRQASEPVPVGADPSKWRAGSSVRITGISAPTSSAHPRLRRPAGRAGSW
jgi:hypothetical protein